MTRLIAVLALGLTIAALAFAQEQKAPSTKITGFLIDNMCLEAADAEEVEGHLISCALIETCIKSGFSVVAKDKTYKLDEKGNKLALKALKATRAKMGMVVTVEGTIEENVFLTTMLVESR